MNSDKKMAIGFISLINALLTPLVFMLLWNWFVTEIGAPRVGYLLSAGITLLADFVLYNSLNKNDLVYKDTDEAIEFKFQNATSGLSFIILTLAIGSLIHLFV